METENFILLTDAYKQTHWFQYPHSVKRVYSYLESRGGKFENTVFFGLQIILKKYFCGNVITQKMIDDADEFCRKVFGQNYFNRDGWEYILDEHNGALPIEIKAVPEGSVIPTHNVLMTVVNTDPAVPFLTNFVETLLMQVWYPTTVATTSWHIKSLIQSYAVQCGEQVSPFHLNDFGFRGVSSVESAGIGGAAHLVNFLGTDTLEGIRYAQDYYGADVCGYSVMAAEHSTVTSYGRTHEQKAYKTFIDHCPDKATVSIVSDSYDLINAVTNIYGGNLRDYILSRDSKLVVRPDSGNPVDISSQVLKILWDKFGGHVNEQGKKVLNPKVGVIYGDGIDYEKIRSILNRTVAIDGFSAGNIIFGMGGALLQGLTRDTMRFAFKCSAVESGNTWIDIYKDPKTDPGKRSMKGRLKLVHHNGTYNTVRMESSEEPDVMQTVFRNGNLLVDHSFEEIRARAQE
jgi:nicotinamide phosphoribosyltransferase